MVKSIYSPRKYVQGSGVLTELERYVGSLGNSFLVVADPFVLEDAVKKIGKGFEGSESEVIFEKFNGECTKKEIDRLIEIAKVKKSDAVIAIGGGKTLDTVKAIGYYTKLPVVIIPTLASCDAPCTALSVIYTEKGEFSEYLFLPENPDIVIVDTDIIVKAPVKFLAAGMGDAFATYYEARACYKADANNLVGTKITKAALALAELCHKTLLEDGLKAKLSNEKGVLTKALENIIEANIYLSGVGAESSGLAAAHAISNGLTVLTELHHASHGEKVAFGTLVQLVLEDAPEEEIREALSFMKNVGLPVSLEEMGVNVINKEAIMKAAEASCAEGDTMHNMPFTVTPEDVYGAIIVANELGKQFK
ncbi:glycerol dehydrogenase [Clostridium pasteurianum DSM 525 = ATCC 6013]|uniref:Glycerol dehydrogenase n=1 Tax=Clostridium pasteurianum DSM 525 = ATCC 6013 TaxID=1262449 RepID=A0A0H3J9A3_CLOPA|nr:glycerol dehydrogenase [Clostridium pasteurianum]AJA49872.1 glycerol dehydrogenase [Clostridium pasteurianum DSM 525 = ATCC 6013]AJA53860.1 glycerol dehydrogenase [Clostridium pasteurianum DSM 525 = ATCC 6013]AOZ77015.1 glycerol dehydrogenase [Clostridium pasteurianum DSM 525 = ATCC 6013]AOZ80812.1 glycerol dehydrogenase [Clostridium pasteurianum]ELP57832.1 glycerol dehydrogenase [Clostridium pasteurianum DSM 525 = ATCC 6013]